MARNPLHRTTLAAISVGGGCLLLALVWALSVTLSAAEPPTPPAVEVTVEPQEIPGPQDSGDSSPSSADEKSTDEKPADVEGAGEAGATVGEDAAASAEPPAPAEVATPSIQSYLQERLAHGPKGPEHQRYVVLHDTEGGGTPWDVVDGWVAQGTGVAAHFVVGRDGTIVQCVPLDAIAHHAGFGTAGADGRFGLVEDGRDDRVGTQEVPWSDDYAMNAWSIGIEMVHRGGQDYPEAQLVAVDGLLAYLHGVYGGSAGQIIDHKAWRQGNSDTDPGFAPYLERYAAGLDHLGNPLT